MFLMSLSDHASLILCIYTYGHREVVRMVHVVGMLANLCNETNVNGQTKWQFTWQAKVNFQKVQMKRSHTTYNTNASQ